MLTYERVIENQSDQQSLMFISRQNGKGHLRERWEQQKGDVEGVKKL